MQLCCKADKGAGKHREELQKALTSWWTVELHYKLVESAKDGDLVLALDAVV